MKTMDCDSAGLARALRINTSSFLGESVARLGTKLSETKFCRKKKKFSVDKGETGKENVTLQYSMTPRVIQFASFVLGTE